MEEVSEKCRLCLKVVFNEKVSLFDTSIGFSYAEVLLQDLCLEISDTSKWPSNVCLECIDLIHQINRFKNRIRTTHKTLIKLCDHNLTEKSLDIHSSRAASPIIFTTDEDEEEEDEVTEESVDNTDKKTPVINNDDDLEQLIEYDLGSCGDNYFDDFIWEDEMDSSPAETVVDSPKPKIAVKPDQCSLNDLTTSLLYQRLSAPAEKPIKHSLIDQPKNLCNQTLSAPVSYSMEHSFIELPKNSCNQTLLAPVSNSMGNSFIDLIIYPTEEAPLKPIDHTTHHSFIDLPFQLTGQIQCEPPEKSTEHRFLDLPLSKEKQLSIRMRNLQLLNCQICKYPTCDLKKFRDHVQDKHTLEGYKFCCTLPLTSDDNEIYDHVKNHLKQGTYCCTQCNLEWICMAAFAQHNRRLHAKHWYNNEVFLNHLSKLTKNGNKLSIVTKLIEIPQKKQEFEAQMLVMNLFTCKWCGTDTGTYYDLKEHLSKEHAKKLKVIDYKMCCHFSWMEPVQLYNHVLLHLGYLACTICYRSSTDANTLHNHMVKFHSPDIPKSIVHSTRDPTDEELELEQYMAEVKLFQCKICDEDQGTLSLLRSHVKSQHELEKYSLCCDLQLLSTAPCKLFDHIRSHLDKNYLVCKECGKKQVDKGRLEQHMLQYHSNESPTNICDTCGKGFFDKNKLKHHIRTHIKVKCPHCQAEVIQPNLMQHVRRCTGKGDITHLCDLCGRGFSSSGQLTTHIMDHGGPHGGRRRKKPKLSQNDHLFKDDYFE